MPSWKKIIQSGSQADFLNITSSAGLITDNVDGGDVKLTIANTNTDTGVDKTAGIFFKHAFDGESTDLRQAGKILASKRSLYAINVGTIMSNLDFYTAGGWNAGQNFVGDIHRFRITGGATAADTQVGI